MEYQPLLHSQSQMSSYFIYVAFIATPNKVDNFLDFVSSPSLVQ